ncbi:MAG: hypothetical protein Q8R67_17740 [Rhodoferax sp.]|nr:hypothetical protein [Rhodoferax sp.]MDP3653514.1 hypothetical protein [Rhodoferax sp.]
MFDSIASFPALLAAVPSAHGVCRAFCQPGGLWHTPGRAAITLHGRTAAFMVLPQDMQDLQEARRKRGTAVEAFEAYFAKARLQAGVVATRS